MDHIVSKESLKPKLKIMYICSITIFIILQVIDKIEKSAYPCILYSISRAAQFFAFRAQRSGPIGQRFYLAKLRYLLINLGYFC